MISHLQRPMSGRRRCLLAVPLLALLGGFSAPAVAGPVTFTTDGTNSFTGSVVNEQTGNVLAVNAQSIVANTPVGQTSTPFQILFQSTITFNSGDSSNPLGYSGTFTATGSYFETATVQPGGFISFGLGGGPSSFNLYFSPTGTPNNLLGTGFTPPHLVFSGTVAADGGIFVNNGGTGLFDQFSNAYGNKQAVNGVGATALSISESFYDTSFFKTNLTGSTLSFNLSNFLPFTTQIDPSKVFFDGTTPFLPTTVGTLAGNTAVGRGGTGPGTGSFDFQFESNGSGSFVTAVPEPASIAMTLMGLCGSGLGMLVSRRRTKVRRSAA